MCKFNIYVCHCFIVYQEFSCPLHGEPICLPIPLCKLSSLYAILLCADVLQTGFFCGQNRAHWSWCCLSTSGRLLKKWLFSNFLHNFDVFIRFRSLNWYLILDIKLWSCRYSPGTWRLKRGQRTSYWSANVFICYRYVSKHSSILAGNF